MDFILFLIIGAIAGSLAGRVMKGRGFGIIGNLIVGVIGAFIGGVVFGLLGIATYGLIGSLISSLVGSIILLWVIGLSKKH
ncbi:transglycosylase-associated protein [Candidatus Scalindua japonica]|uniref:Transglycosylase-associated protein n=1 Tax=Candidatus Scalindua japonica TaxID=1284222 RepID=A0A286U007_9BACT|nr:GlsB/YeaQ/YmgE family stress response membrane protein [Candidatus Scalindua japonica]GAX61475.1 transglycosylase-associated protein [Candidatus Scalindua japonica]